MIKNKKASEGMPWYMMMMIVAVLGGAVILGIAANPFSVVHAQSKGELLDIQIKNCVAKSTATQPDFDSDGLPDFCDPCVDLGLVASDIDGDQVPDECEPDTKGNPDKITCKNKLDGVSTGVHCCSEKYNKDTCALPFEKQDSSSSSP